MHLPRNISSWVERHPLLSAGLLASTYALYRARRRRMRERSFPDFYRRAIEEVCQALDKLSAPYWFTEGTLIALLRFGQNIPETDDDIDVMVEVESEQHWLSVADQLRRELGSQGWSHTPAYSTYGRRGRKDKVKFRKRGPHCKTHLDLHSYMLDREDRVAKNHSSPQAYPFQGWGGAMPSHLIHPLRVVKCYEREAPCPNRPLELLRGWNGKEYGESVLAFPPRPLQPEEVTEILQCCRELDSQGYCSFAEELFGSPSPQLKRWPS